MKLVGNILRIKNKRDSQHQDIEIHIDKITYLTQKKDGRFYQSFEFIDELDTPLVLTGDCLARTPNTDFEEEDFTYQVFDKTHDTYTLNPHKELTLTLVYAEEAEQLILSAGTYAVTVLPAEFEQLKRDRSKSNKLNNTRKHRKN
jgi:hypothetical protein